MKSTKLSFEVSLVKLVPHSVYSVNSSVACSFYVCGTEIGGGCSSTSKSRRLTSALFVSFYIYSAFLGFDIGFYGISCFVGTVLSSSCLLYSTFSSCAMLPPFLYMVRGSSSPGFLTYLRLTYLLNTYLLISSGLAPILGLLGE